MIAIGTKTANLTNGYRGNIGMVAKRLSTMNITEVNFYRRQANGRDRIPQSHTGMGVGPWIDYNPIFLPEGTLDTVHQITFTVGLKKIQLCPQLFSPLLQPYIQGFQGLMTVNFRLSYPQHIQIRPMDDLNAEQEVFL